MKFGRQAVSAPKNLPPAPSARRRIPAGALASLAACKIDFADESDYHNDHLTQDAGGCPVWGDHSERKARMFEFLFLDLDETILDFHKAEYIAIGKTLAAVGIDPTDEVRARYSQINLLHWHMLERGELTRDQVLVQRFEMLLGELGVRTDARECARTYGELLGVGHYFLPGAEEALEKLHGKYRLYLASNGTASVQAGRMKSANLHRFFEDIFISQEMGANKPSKDYFDRCFARIPGFEASKAMIVGDSLTSDILGGRNAGIATCWVNPKHLHGREDIRPDYEIEGLFQLPALLQTV